LSALAHIIMLSLCLTFSRYQTTGMGKFNSNAAAKFKSLQRFLLIYKLVKKEKYCVSFFNQRV